MTPSSPLRTRPGDPSGNLPAPGPGRCRRRAAGDIAERLGIASPTLSFHLAQLKHAGLVHVRRDGRSLIYAANYGGMRGSGLLTENCCGRGRASRALAPIRLDHPRSTQEQRSPVHERLHVHVSVEDLDRSVRFYAPCSRSSRRCSRRLRQVDARRSPRELRDFDARISLPASIISASRSRMAKSFGRSMAV